MISMVMSSEVYDCILPKPQIASKDWMPANLKMTKHSKTTGFFDIDAFPHVTEILDCFDDPYYLQITFQTASQVGKTLLAQACLAKIAACDPHPMAFADADEKSTRRVIERTWDLFEACEALTGVCPPKHLRSSDKMALKTCLIHGAWAGSAATAADFGALVVVLNECDKMKQKSTDLEADFRELLKSRVKGYDNTKILQISTPTLKDQSYIEAERLRGDNRARLVPCPFCNHFQELFIGDGKQPGGIRWDRLKNGKHDIQKAEETAYILCKKCDKKIYEEHRRGMLQAGLWVPEGCKISRGKVTGKPVRPGRHASFGPLSTIHSLLAGISIGHIAAKKVEAITDPIRAREKNRDITNSWDGKTYDPQPTPAKPDELIERFSVQEPLRIAPIWSRFLTLASDVGRVEDLLIYYWAVCAWGLHARGQLIDLGVAWGDDEMIDVLRYATYEHADGGSPLRPVKIGIDSGDGVTTEAVYDFCKNLPNATPLKGSSDEPGKDFVDANFPEMYRPGIQRIGLTDKQAKAKKRARNFDLITVNTHRSQNWIEERIAGHVKPDDANHFSIPHEALEGQVLPDVDLCHHLLGDFRDDKGRWRKRYDKQHFRDTVRYNVVMAWFHTMNGRNWNRLADRKTTSQAKSKKPLRPTLRKRPRLTPGG